MADDDFHNAYNDGVGESSIISVGPFLVSFSATPDKRCRALSHAQNPNRMEYQTRGLEAFGRKVTTTASHLIAPLSGGGDPMTTSSYQTAMGDVHKQLLRRPTMQRGILTMARTTPTDLVRSKLSRTEIQHRALAYLPDDVLSNIPDEDTNSYSLFQGFQASLPELAEDDDGQDAGENGKKHRRRVSRGRKLLMLEETMSSPDSPQLLQKLRKEKSSMMRELEMLGVRKNMASSEIRDIDNKIANLSGMRRIILERLAGLEQEEALLEHDSTLPVSWRRAFGRAYANAAPKFSTWKTGSRRRKSSSTSGRRRACRRRRGRTRSCWRTTTTASCRSPST